MVRVQDLSAHSIQESLSNISFEIKSGEVLAVIGPSDSGKHLLGEVLSGKRPPTAGEILLNNYRHQTHQHKVKIQSGYVANPVQLEGFMSGFELLDLIGAIYHLSPELRAQQIASLDQQLEIGADLYSLLERSSLATRQKIGLAAALIHTPQFLVLDEPTQFLDFQGQLAAENLLADRTQSGCSTILITDNLGLAERLASRFIILDTGKLVMEGTLTQLHNLTKSSSKSLASVLMTLFGHA